jgi:hypothetical protein
MPTLILTTPTNPGQSMHTDSDAELIAKIKEFHKQHGNDPVKFAEFREEMRRNDVPTLKGGLVTEKVR